MLKKSYRILDAFLVNPTKAYISVDIKKLIRSKSESYTYNSLDNFAKQGILIKEKKGGLNFYRANSTPKAIAFLSMAAEYKAWTNKNIPKESIFSIAEKIKTNFFTLMVVGSYAKGNITERSDIDIILLVPKDARKISSELQHFCEMSIPQIHLYAFTDDEFKQMLLDKKQNFGKEAVKNNLIFYGAEAYYNTVFGAIKNGFSY